MRAFPAIRPVVLAKPGTAIQKTWRLQEEMERNVRMGKMSRFGGLLLQLSLPSPVPLSGALCCSPFLALHPPADLLTSTAAKRLSIVLKLKSTHGKASFQTATMPIRGLVPPFLIARVTSSITALHLKITIKKNIYIYINFSCARHLAPLI